MIKMRTVCSRWILGIAYTALGASALGCGNKDPEEVKCRAGYVALRIEPDRDKFVCTKAPHAECDEGFFAVPADDGTFVCMEDEGCGEDAVAVRQPNGTYSCIATIDVDCPEGKLPVEASNGTFACMDPLKIECGDGEYPIEGPNGTFACMAPVEVECPRDQIVMEGENGIISCISPPDINCDDGAVAVLQGDVFACIDPVNIECPRNKVPIEAANGTYACKSPLEVDCDEGTEAVLMDDGTYSCVALDVVECDDGYMVTQGGQGMYSCVEVQEDDLEPGSIICPEGTRVEYINGNEARPICVQIDAIDCGEGFEPVLKTGRWECVFSDIGDQRVITVDGAVVDEYTRLPLEGVLVTILGLTDADGETISTTTDENGLWRVEGNATGGSITAAYSLEGYVTKAKSHIFQDHETLGHITQPEDYTFTDDACSGGSADGGKEGDRKVCGFRLPPLPATEPVVAGTVLAFGAPATGARVQLRATSGNQQELLHTAIQETVTGADGRFAFEPVPDGSYEIVVDQYDINGDGVVDFRIKQQNVCLIGGPHNAERGDEIVPKDPDNPLLSECMNQIGDLRVALDPALEFDLIATNLTDPDGGPVDALDDDFSKLFEATEAYLLPVGATDISFTVTDPLQADPPPLIELFYHESGSPAAPSTPDAANEINVGVNIDAAATSMVITPTPAEGQPAVVGDLNPSTYYELRFHDLRWEVGEYVARQRPEGNAWASIFFDVVVPAPALPAPTDVQLFWLHPAATATPQGAIDSTSAFAINASGTWVEEIEFGGAGTLANGQAAATPNVDRLQIAWTPIEGAANYAMYARTMDPDTGAFPNDWILIDDELSPQGYGTLVHAPLPLQTILSGDGADIPDSGLTDLSNIHGYTPQVQVVIASVNADGVIGYPTAASALTIQDTNLWGLGQDSSIVNHPIDGSDPIDHTPVNGLVIAEVELDFGEKVTTTGWEPFLTSVVTSSTILGASTTNSGFGVVGAPDYWGVVDITDPYKQTGQPLRAELIDKRFDRCAQLAANAVSGDITLTLKGGANVFAGAQHPAVIFNDTSKRNTGGITIAAVVTDTSIRLAAPLPPVDGMATPPVMDNPPLEDDWICSTAGVPTLGAITTLPTTQNMALNVPGAVVDNSLILVPTAADQFAVQLNPTVDAVNGNTAYVGRATFAESSYAFRVGTSALYSAEKLSLAGNGTVSGTNLTLPLEMGEIGTYEIMVGDAVMVDVDGRLATGGDRYVGLVSGRVATVSSENVATSESITVTGATVTTQVDASNSLVVLIRHGFTLSNFATLVDSNGNDGASAFYNQLATCSSLASDGAGEEFCQNGVLLF
jgi:hypothetical protein